MEWLWNWFGKLTIGDVLNVLSMFGAVFAAIYGALTSTKKYELREAYRQEILGWYAETSGVMLDVIHFQEYGMLYEEGFRQERAALLSRLSRQIDLGRFYFPNELYTSQWDAHKPEAYKGMRHPFMQHLMDFYRAVLGGEDQKLLDALWEHQRAFTSEIFKLLDPRKQNEKLEKLTGVRVPKH